jgi:CheY-like chemotaxis protein
MTHLLDAPGTCRVLVADDDHDSADTLVALLRDWGFSAQAVYDGAEAVLAEEALQPSLVLMDIGMADVDGYRAALMIRSAWRLRRARLVALTGRNSDADRLVSACVGFDDHICKPIARARLQLLALDAGPAAPRGAKA